MSFLPSPLKSPAASPSGSSGVDTLYGIANSEVHAFALHELDTQSALAVHALAVPQRGHVAPPQSTSDSIPFLMLSMQELGVVHTLLTQLRFPQSVFIAHFSPTAHGG